MRFVTKEDIRDVYIKLNQRGLAFIFSKFNLVSSNRTRSSFNSVNIESSSWWIIPKIKRRWNKMITGDENICYESYISNEILKTEKTFKLISIGSGISSHEIILAELNPKWEIVCIDISEKLIEKAKLSTNKKKIKNIKFLNQNFYDLEIVNHSFNAVLFHSSLHHFKNIDNLILKKVVKMLKPKGKLIINEYVGPNRLQYGKQQLLEINNCINVIDKKYRKIYKTKIYKNKFYGSGLLRMIVADPSECVDSESILPSIYKSFNVLIEKPFGGNLLMSALKDISHHFIDANLEKEFVLDKMIEIEDNYLLNNKSNFVFGVYELK